MDIEAVNNKKKEYARMQTRAFSIVLEVIAIFAFPALLIVGVSKWLSISDTYTYILLAIMFVLSWAVLIKRVRDMGKRLEQMREEINRQE